MPGTGKQNRVQPLTPGQQLERLQMWQAAYIARELGRPSETKRIAEAIKADRTLQAALHPRQWNGHERTIRIDNQVLERIENVLRGRRRQSTLRSANR